MKHLCYIASGWFNEKQANDLTKIEAMLTDTILPSLPEGNNYYSPRLGVQCTPFDSMEIKQQVFDSNVAAIRDSLFVIVNTRDKDMGTIFEAGYANALGKPIIYYCEGLTGNFNLMLAQSGIAVATSIVELQTHVTCFLADFTYSEVYNGIIE